MTKTTSWYVKTSLIGFALLLSSSPALAEELVIRSCGDLLRMAQSYQEDVKTVDIVLGSAIDAGNLERIKNYKLKKSAISKDLDAVLKAIDAKGCVKK